MYNGESSAHLMIPILSIKFEEFTQPPNLTSLTMLPTCFEAFTPPHYLLLPLPLPCLCPQPLPSLQWFLCLLCWCCTFHFSNVFQTSTRFPSFMRSICLVHPGCFFPVTKHLKGVVLHLNSSEQPCLGLLYAGYLIM